MQFLIGNDLKQLRLNAKPNPNL